MRRQRRCPGRIVRLPGRGAIRRDRRPDHPGWPDGVDGPSGLPRGNGDQLLRYRPHHARRSAAPPPRLADREHLLDRRRRRHPAPVALRRIQVRGSRFLRRACRGDGTARHPRHHHPALRDAHGIALERALQGPPRSGGGLVRNRGVASFDVGRGGARGAPHPPRLRARRAVRDHRPVGQGDAGDPRPRSRAGHWRCRRRERALARAWRRWRSRLCRARLATPPAAISCTIAAPWWGRSKWRSPSSRSCSSPR